MIIQRWKEKLYYSAFVDQKETVTNERLVEVQMVYYYQRMDTQDFITTSGISDIEDGYLLLSDLGLRALFSVYCRKIKDFDQYIFKNEMKEPGFNKISVCKVFSQFEVWRNSLPKDLTEDEVKGS